MTAEEAAEKALRDGYLLVGPIRLSDLATIARYSVPAGVERSIVHLEHGEGPRRDAPFDITLEWHRRPSEVAPPPG